MLNKIVIMGRLTRDPELRRTQSGTPVTGFSLAVDRDFKSQSGDKETDFIDVVAWRQTAEFVARYFAKGDPIAVTGRIQSRAYQAKDGSRRTAVEIAAESVYFAGGSKQRDAVKPAGRPIDVSAAGFDEVDEDGDIPF